MSSILPLATAVASARPKAPPQAGILEGVNPVDFDPKHPITLFIVQVRFTRPSFCASIQIFPVDKITAHFLPSYGPS